MALIPIVMSADENYAMPLCVTIKSILTSKEITTNYFFYILIPNDFSNSSKQRMEELVGSHPGSKIEFMIMDSDRFTNIPMTHAHITTPTYYRLIISELLTNHDKCIYLDVDIIVCEDLTELYDYDLSSAYIAGVKSPIFHLMYKGGMDYCRTIGVESLDQYVNAGVLLMNLKAIREDKISSKFMQLIHRKFPTQDQDIINRVCYDNIILLPLKFNFPPIRFDDPKIVSRLSGKVFSEHEIEQARDNPVIIHFSSYIKPWDNITLSYSYFWWKSALNTAYSEQLWDKLVCMSKVKKHKMEDKLTDKIKWWIYSVKVDGLLFAIKRVVRKILKKGST